MRTGRSGRLRLRPGRIRARALPGEALVAAALRQVTALGYVRLEDRRWPDAVPLGPGTVLVGPAGVFAVDVLRRPRAPRRGPEAVLDHRSVRRRRERAERAAAAIAGLLHPALGRHVHAVVAVVGVGPLPARAVPAHGGAGAQAGARAGDVAALVSWLAVQPPRLAPHLVERVADTLARALPPAPPVQTPSARQVSGLVNPRPLAGLLDRIRRS
ncbi:hypothetical protein [Motilibacter aurantiacus]|uniref:hypothetical protein n=1 Tax=Motilibacter aurantiacus TaxID=2714955 RepID=UPI00140B20B6|nr:hypothetical protein [Motilibacter aurantiacus]NHC44462.1 hypothetical protein [Motilibacter aurantiacus]